MASIYDIKPAFQNLLRPTTKFFAGKGVTANQVTVGAMVLSIITGFCIFRFHSNRYIFFLLPVFLFIRMALNAIDGMLAREHDMKSNLGAFLNELGDVVSDAALYLPFMMLVEFNVLLVVGVVLGSCISEMAGVVARGNLAAAPRASVGPGMDVCTPIPIPTGHPGARPDRSVAVRR